MMGIAAASVAVLLILSAILTAAHDAAFQIGASHIRTLQDEGFDTVDANLNLGLPVDSRDYGVGAQILYDLGVRSMRLLTNNPTKRAAIEGYGLSIIEQLPLAVEANEENREYLHTKAARLGHQIDFGEDE
jgi:3,4-dihydroxy 2-butanone 4-phosphate synthase/GTP cyclohydrolase II